MREIKYRAISKNTGEFVYGSLMVWDCGMCEIMIPDESLEYNKISVNPTTVGQCTGLKDQNGTEIYEGDIIKYLISGQKRNGVVIWAKEICAFYMDDDFLCHHRHRNISDWMQKYFHKEGVFEVIGNIHENPEIEHLKIVEV